MDNTERLEHLIAHYHMGRKRTCRWRLSMPNDQS